MTDSNPYSPPSDLGVSGPSAQQAPAPGSPSPNAVEHLRRTRPWTMFLSILGFIGGGLMALATLFMGIGAAAGSSEFMGGEDAAVVLALAAFYAVATVMYILVSVLLFKYGRAIGYLLQFGRNQELEEALDAQRRFWKAMGVIAIVTMALMVVAMFVGVGIAIADGL
jgi:hypothetical protein